MPDNLTTEQLANRYSRTEVRTELPPGRDGDHPRLALFPESDLEGLRTRWRQIQANFVDEPRKAVEEADGLVASMIDRIVNSFADERRKLEHEWEKGKDASTEDLRQSIQRYRSFFDRLLSV